MDWSSEIAGLPSDQQDLASRAADASKNADAEYSDFRVGAALRIPGGDVFTATNVENSSFGLTSCAERNAVFRAVGEKGPSVRFDLIALVAISDRIDPSSGPTISPCGACRQVLERFKADEQARVLFVKDGQFVTMTIRELFPAPFSLPDPRHRPDNQVD
jgi:homotetrameric cytidine deaminase